MVEEDKSDFGSKKEENMGFNDTKNSFSPTHKLSKPMIAGVILIIAGLVSLALWAPVLMIDESSIDDLKQNDATFSDLTDDHSSEEIRESYMICGTIGLIIAIFIILGGILAVRKKMWVISITAGFIGSFTLVQILIPGILCIIAVMLLILSKKEFQ